MLYLVIYLFIIDHNELIATLIIYVVYGNNCLFIHDGSICGIINAFFEELIIIVRYVRTFSGNSGLKSKILILLSSYIYYNLYLYKNHLHGANLFCYIYTVKLVIV